MAPTLHELYRSCDAGYNEARKHFDEDDLEGAVDRAERVLSDDGLLRYHRIRPLFLIAACAADWDEAEELIDHANVLFIFEEGVRRRYDGEKDRLIRELREELAAVKEQHEAERPVGEDIDEAIEDLDEAMEEACLDEEDLADEDYFAGEEDEFAGTREDIVRESEDFAEKKVDEFVEEDEFVGEDAEAVATDHLEGSAAIARGRQDDPEKLEEQRPSAGGRARLSLYPSVRI